MSEWAPLPDHIDLSYLQETQEKWIERVCPDGVMGMIKRIVGRHKKPRSWRGIDHYRC